ncbi:mucin-like protein [Branchiostoma lanceolatum]|uniref:mucin-like protein n=1 Tax=Branchiostoma lanceolatum TaxID=7740 RepID=UPI003456CD3D
MTRLIAMYCSYEPIKPSRDSNLPRVRTNRDAAVAGYSAGDGSGLGPGNVEGMSPYSGTSAMLTLFFHPSNRAGYWKFALQDQAATPAPAASVVHCSAWIRQQDFETPTTLPGYHELPRPGSCPCNLEQAYHDRRYTLPGFSIRQNHGDICAISRVKVRSYVDSRMYRMWQICCYGPSYYWRERKRPCPCARDRIGNGKLKSGHAGGHLVVNNQNEDRQAYQDCCVSSSSYFCNKFKQLRPLSVPSAGSSCTNYNIGCALARSWYDPHIQTLDGRNYTFNGLGEYVLLDLNDEEYQVQARTSQAEGTSHATVFTSIVAYQMGHSPIQVNLVGTDGLQLYVNYTAVDMTLFVELQHEEEVEDIASVSALSNSSLLIFFYNELSVKVTAQKAMLHLEYAVPDQYQKKTKGLLGYWDGNSENDFVAFDESVLPSDSSEEDIFNLFGETWQVTEEDGPKITRFFYESGMTTSSYKDSSYVPHYTDQVIFSSTELEQQANAVCGDDRECLFDISETGDVEVGELSVVMKEDLEIEKIVREIFPPTLHGPEVVNATVGERLQFTLNATDRNGLDMMFELGAEVPDDDVTLSLAGNVATISWLVTSDDPFNLQIDVTNSENATAQLWPTVNMCSCLNGGVCEGEAAEEQNSDGNTKFVTLECTCPAGYTGKKCETDLDACVENFNPCFSGVVCTDRPPPADIDGFDCGDCPPGFNGDGENCIDIDECTTGEGSVCHHHCINSVGNFSCGCNEGYYLTEDGVTCEDVNECDLPNNCTQLCLNNDGSFNCSCQDGFMLAADGQDCEPTNPCSAENNPGCDEDYGWCAINSSSGIATCVCMAGYQRNSDGVTCEDIDECLTGDSHCDQRCNNTMGAYECYCEDGYELTDNPVQPCQDIDECFEGLFNCSSNEVCENAVGTYSCVCEEGTILVDGACVRESLTTTPHPTTMPTTTATTSGPTMSMLTSPVTVSARKDTTESMASSSVSTSQITKRSTVDVEAGVTTSPSSDEEQRTTGVQYRSSTPTTARKTTEGSSLLTRSATTASEFSSEEEGETTMHHGDTNPLTTAVNGLLTTKEASAPGELEMNTLLLTLNMDIDELTADRLENFKAAVAREMTSFCRRHLHELADCRVSGPARSYIAAVYTVELVFIPPGYPQQSPVAGQTLLAFFVAHPDSLGTNLRPVSISYVQMMMDTSVEEVAVALGDAGSIAGVLPLLDYIYGKDVTTMIPTKGQGETEPEEPGFPIQTVIIAICGAVAVAVIIVAVIGTTWFCKRTKTCRQAPINVHSAPPPDLGYSVPSPDHGWRMDPQLSTISLKGRDSPFLKKTNLWE